MGDYVKNYWSIFSVVITLAVSLITQWAILGVRISNVESRQDRQAETIRLIQTQVGDLNTALSGMKEKVDAINDNVNYIRSRIDNAVQ